MRHRSRYTYRDGWRRFYLDSVDGSRVVLLLHGIPTNHLLWTEVVENVNAGIRAIAPDLTGFGLSDLPENADLSPMGQATDVVSFLDGLGVESFTVVAHDFGLLVACELLALYPERVNGLIITNTSLRFSDWRGAGPNPFRLLRIPVVGEVAFAFARRWMLRLAFLPFVAERERLTEDVLDRFWKPFELGFDRTLLRVFRTRAIDTDVLSRWRRALQSYSGPVTLVWGTQDPAFRIDRGREIAELVPQSQLISLHGSSHIVPIDRPRVLSRAINRQMLAD